MLLALLISHPTLIEQVAERLGEAHFSDSLLDNLRRGILKHLDVAHDLDEEAICAHLRSDGYTHVLASVQAADDYKISRHEAVRDAKALWEHVFTLYSRKDLQADVGQAVETLARESSDVNFARLKAVVFSRARSVQVEDEEPAPREGAEP